MKPTDDQVVLLVPAEEWIVQLNGRSVRVPAGHLAVWWSGAAHHRPPDDTEAMASVALPQLLAWDVPGCDLLLEGKLILDQPRPGDARQLRQWVRELAGDDCTLRRAAELELHGRLLRLPTKAARPEPASTDSA
ncbi:MAG: hypothetical protein AAGK78_06850, partial [Planctomycetota bacterium]